MLLKNTLIPKNPQVSLETDTSGRVDFLGHLQFSKVPPVKLPIITRFSSDMEDDTKNH